MFGASPSTENNEHEVFSKAAGGSSTKKNKNKNNNNSRRFSDEQIKSLESLFKTENKLEPRKKLEMARELGLHPRQVAIWFQNRRARWKSKQMEQDYTTLRADYDTLSDRFQCLKKEKHALLKQLRNVCNQLKEPHEAGSKYDLDSWSENDGELNGNSSGFSGPLEEQDMQQAAIYYSEEDDPIKHNDDENQKDELDENVKMQGGDYEVSKEEEEEEEESRDEKVKNFDLGSLFDQTCSSNWWDVWSTY